MTKQCKFDRWSSVWMDFSLSNSSKYRLLPAEGGRVTLSSASYLADDSVEVVARIHWGRRDVEGAPPYFHLGFSVLGGGLWLVQPREAPVVAFVEPPRSVHRHPHLVNAVQHHPQGANGPLQHRGVADVKFIAGVCSRSGSVSLDDSGTSNKPKWRMN